MSDNQFESLPEIVKETAHSLLDATILEARTMEPPGDGSMLILGDRTIGEGMWSDNGYKLQASFVEDARMRNGPFVRVYVYQNSQVSRAWVEAGVEYTADDLLALDITRLAGLKVRHVKIGTEIADLEASIKARAPGSPKGHS